VMQGCSTRESLHTELETSSNGSLRFLIANRKRGHQGIHQTLCHVGVWRGSHAIVSSWCIQEKDLP
jgi:hypothetical protein